MPAFEPHAERLIVKPAADYEHFFRISVALPTKLSCIRARMEPRQASVFTRVFIDAQREFLGNGFQSFDRSPASSAVCGQRVPVRSCSLCHESVPLENIQLSPSQQVRVPELARFPALNGIQVFGCFASFIAEAYPNDHPPPSAFVAGPATALHSASMLFRTVLLALCPAMLLAQAPDRAAARRKESLRSAIEVVAAQQPEDHRAYHGSRQIVGRVGQPHGRVAAGLRCYAIDAGAAGPA